MGADTCSGCVYCGEEVDKGEAVAAFNFPDHHPDGPGVHALCLAAHLVATDDVCNTFSCPLCRNELQFDGHTAQLVGRTALRATLLLYGAPPAMEIGPNEALLIHGGHTLRFTNESLTLCVDPGKTSTDETQLLLDLCEPTDDGYTVSLAFGPGPTPNNEEVAEIAAALLTDPLFTVSALDLTSQLQAEDKPHRDGFTVALCLLFLRRVLEQGPRTKLLGSHKQQEALNVGTSAGVAGGLVVGAGHTVAVIERKYGVGVANLGQQHGAKEAKFEAVNVQAAVEWFLRLYLQDTAE